MSGIRTSKKQTERVTITPAMAAEILEYNTLNRPISDVHVQRIAREIKRGRWRFNGDTIKIADTNDVLDGQHRLWAITLADMPVETIIVRGIKKDAFSTIDTTRRMRSGGDVLALAGAQRYRNIAASSLQWLIRWQRDVIPTYREPRNKIENHDIEEAFENHPRIINAVEKAVRVRAIVNPSLFAFVLYVVSNRDPELAERIQSTFESPVGVSLNDPLFVLRGQLLTMKENGNRRMDPIYLIAIMFKAINAANEGREIKMLNWRRDGKYAEEFPFLDV